MSGILEKYSLNKIVLAVHITTIASQSKNKCTYFLWWKFRALLLWRRLPLVVTVVTSVGDFVNYHFCMIGNIAKFEAFYLVFAVAIRQYVSRFNDISTTWCEN